MENKPRMMTIREIASTGLLSEHALRLMLKEGKLPAIYIGKKALINYNRLYEELQSLEADITKETTLKWFSQTKLFGKEVYANAGT